VVLVASKERVLRELALALMDARAVPVAGGAPDIVPRALGVADREPSDENVDSA